MPETHHNSLKAHDLAFDLTRHFHPSIDCPDTFQGRWQHQSLLDFLITASPEPSALSTILARFDLREELSFPLSVLSLLIKSPA
jgi:hypothetical protein